MNSLSTIFLVAVLHAGHFTRTFLLDLLALLREVSFGFFTPLKELFPSFLVEFTADSLSSALIVALLISVLVSTGFVGEPVPTVFVIEPVPTVFVREFSVLQNIFREVFGFIA